MAVHYVVVLAHPVVGMNEMPDEEALEKAHAYRKLSQDVLGAALESVGRSLHPSMAFATYILDNRLGVHTAGTVPLRGHEQAMTLLDALQECTCEHFRISITLNADWAKRDEPIDLLEAA